jgi:hypothetical protein
MPTLASYLMEGSATTSCRGTPAVSATADAGAGEDESMRGMPNVDTFMRPPVEAGRQQQPGSPGLKPPGA